MKTNFKTYCYLIIIIALYQLPVYATITESNFNFSYPDEFHKTIIQTQLINNNWINFVLDSMSFDNKGRNTEEIQQIWLDNNWGNQVRNTYLYDSILLINSHYNYVWQTSDWLTVTNDSTKYDDKGNLLWFKNYQSGKLVYSSSSAYTQLDSLTQEILTDEYENYSHENTNKFKVLNYFNSDTLQIKSTTFMKDSAQNWLKTQEVLYTYDSRRRNTEQITSALRDLNDTGSWGKSSEYKFTYDDNDSLIELDATSYNAISNTEIIIKYYFDNNRNLYRETQLFITDKVETAWLVKTYAYDAQNRLILRNEKYYTDTDLAVEKADSQIITSYLYPNPCVSQCNIIFTVTQPNNAKFTIFNSLGMKFKYYDLGFSDLGEHRVSLQLQDLVSGNYVCSLQIGNNKMNYLLKIIK